VEVHCRQCQVDSSEFLAITGSDFTSTSDPVIEVLELDAEERGLKLVQPRIATASRKVVAALSSIVAQLTHSLSKHRIVRGHGSSIAERTQILRRVKTPRSGIAPTTDWSTIVRGTVRLRGIKYQSYTVLRRKFLEAIDINGSTVEMNWEKSRSPQADRCFGRGRSHDVRDRIRLDRHRSRSHCGNSKPSGDVGIRGDDHFISGTDPECLERQRERIETGADSDSEIRTTCLGPLPFKCCDLLTQYEPPPVDHSLGSGEEIGSQRPMQGGEISEWHCGVIH
jgi:hypothetical protein